METVSQNHKIFDVHILGTCVHIYTKYEVSMFNHVARRAATQNSDGNSNTDSDTDRDRDNDRQSMIV